MQKDEFPQPSREALEHSARLDAYIKERIEADGGWISFENFMDLALYAPGLGYYSAGAHKLGEAGDFVTAPEISPLFGQCLAGQFVEVLDELEGGDILELGAGSGVLAVDVLREMSRLGQLPDHYYILEVSPDLQERQQQRIAADIPELADRVSWLESLPSELRGVIFGNEVLDALPVARFRIDEAGIREEGVACDDGKFRSVFRPADRDYAQALRNALEDVTEPLPTPYNSEFSRQVPALVAALADRLDEGLLLFIDYGYGRREYYLPERNMGTLMCHYRHRAHSDAFLWPGLQDITAFVDFTLVAEAGVENDLELMSYTTQAQFLLGSGLEGRMADRQAGTPPEQRKLSQQLKLSQQVQRLTLPGEMGDRFKVIALSRGLEKVLSGFSLRDLSSSL